MSGDDNAPVNDEPASPTDDAENGSAIQDHCKNLFLLL